MRAAIFVLAIVMVAARAVAAPAPEMTIDVDGDGAMDKVRIEEPGQMVIERAKGGGQLVPFGLVGAMTEARLTVAGPGLPYVVGAARIGGRWEAIALRLPRGGARLAEVWRGPVGPAGDDDEYELWVAAEADGLVRFQTRPDHRRCDGVMTALFRERWDERAGAFVAAAPAPIEIPAGAPTVTAIVSGPGLPGGWYRPASASVQAGARDASMLSAPRELDDDPASAWREDGPDDGRGTVWNFRASVAGGRAAAIRIVPMSGAAGGKGVADPRTFNRIARLAVIGAGGATIVEVPDPFAGGSAVRTPAGGTAAAPPVYTAALPSPIEGCVSVALLDVHRGKGAARGGGTTAVAGLVVLADVELTPEGAAPVLAAQVVAGGLASESASRALVARAGAAIVAIEAALVGAKGAGRGRLVATLAKIRDPAAIGAIAAALSDGTMPANARDDAAATLAALGPDGKAALDRVIAAPAAAEADRIAAATALATIDRAALIARAGQGRPTTRAAIARLLVPLGVSPLVAAAQAASDELAAADLWRAAVLAAADIDAAGKAGVAATLQAALDAAGDRYELRYRLIAGIGALGSGDALVRLGATLAALPDTAAGHALARVGAHALAENRDPAARRALAALAAARDPGTRLEAIRGLAIDGGDADPAGDDVLVAALSADAWPAIRKHAAAALGPRCRPAPRGALLAAIEQDPEIPVRVDAVTALAQCPAPDLDTRLLRLADDGRTPLPVRDRALAVFADLDRPDRGVALTALLSRFVRWRGQAFSDDAALRMAIRAATALGNLGDPRAGQTLVDAAGDAAFPELASAAIRALGALGKACPRTAPAVLRTLASSDEPQISIAARAAARTCR